MTKITATENNNHFEFSFLNHADDRRVCAAISALICTLHGRLLSNPDAVCVYVHENPGDTKIEWIAQDESAREDAYIILHGLIQLEITYPEMVEIEQNIFSYTRCFGGDSENSL